ncbi:hypothetical protein G6F32_012559 [Rhizopus arrhizus]|nr:hypothetical protein G6F32_012559 [Rhizopus arrhizus]
MSDRIIEFNPAPANARGSNSAGQPIALPSRAVVPEFVSSDGILDSFAYPRPGYPPTVGQNTSQTSALFEVVVFWIIQ